ncbi:MAG: hypothetical protein ABFD83_12100 [Armatimonadota bacterium]
MKSRSGFVLLIISSLLISLATSADAVGKITMDPNTPEALAKASVKEGFWTADERLAQKVGVQAKRQTVCSIISQISENTGVKIDTGISEQDWQVRDRKMIIFAKEMPLANLMQSIARVMKFDWMRTKSSGVYSYRLYMDRNTLINAEAQAYREEERFRREQSQKREAIADELKSVADLSDADMAKLKAEDPMMYALAKSGMASSLGEVFSNMPDMLDSFIDGSVTHISAATTSDETRSAMLGVAKGIVRLTPGISDVSEDNLSSNPDILQEISVQPAYDSDSENVASNILSRFMLGEIDFKYMRIDSDGNDLGESEFGFPIFDPSTSIGSAFGRAMADAMDVGSTNIKNGYSINLKLDPDEMKKVNFGEPVVEHEKDLDIPGEVDFSQNGKDRADPLLFEEKLEKLAEATGLNVVSDCFTDEINDLSSGKQPAKAVLQGLEIVNTYNWWKRGSTIELRDRYWFRKRSLEIPEAWLVKWRDNFKTTGTLDIDDLAEMAVLVGESAQYKMNITKDEILGGDTLRWLLQQHKSFLRFYATVSSTQRAALYTKEGLDLASLPRDQKQNAAKYLNWWDGKSSVAIKGTKNDVNKQFVYSFVEQNINIESITTPKYSPLKTE